MYKYMYATADPFVLHTTLKKLHCTLHMCMCISLLCCDNTILYAGPVDASKTVFVNQTAVIVVTKGVYSGMGMIPKDCFGNVAIITEDLLSIDIHKVDS